MYLKQNRFLSVLAASAAALALGAAPAMAGENDDDGDDDEPAQAAPVRRRAACQRVRVAPPRPRGLTPCFSGWRPEPWC